MSLTTYDELGTWTVAQCGHSPSLSRPGTVAAGSYGFLFVLVSRPMRGVPSRMPAGQGPPAAACLGREGSAHNQEHARIVNRPSSASRAGWSQHDQRSLD